MHINILSTCVRKKVGWTTQIKETEKKLCGETLDRKPSSY